MYKLLFLSSLLLTFVFAKEVTQTNDNQKTSITKFTKPVAETQKLSINASKANTSNTSNTDKAPQKNFLGQLFSKISPSMASKLGPNVKSYWYHAPSKSIIFFKSSNSQEDNKDTTPKTSVKNTKNISQNNKNTNSQADYSSNSDKQSQVIGKNNFYQKKIEASSNANKTSSKSNPSNFFSNWKQSSFWKKYPDNDHIESTQSNPKNPPKVCLEEVQPIDSTKIPLYLKSLQNSAATTLTLTPEQLAEQGIFYPGGDLKYYIIEE